MPESNRVCEKKCTLELLKLLEHTGFAPAQVQQTFSNATCG